MKKEIGVMTPIALMGDLDKRIYFKTYWNPEEIKELGGDKIREPAIGSFSGIDCVYRKGDIK